MPNDMQEISPVADFNDQAYRRMGLGAQRRFPNEEFCRFMGRNFFAVPFEQRGAIRILEIGCGAASNLWMVAREGFEAHGFDLSEAAIPLAQSMLANYGTTATLQVADMRAMPYPDAHFDCVVDVYASYCVNEADFRQTLAEVARVLKPKGRFFIYTPGKGSHAWTDHAPAHLIDPSTLNGIMRETSAYFPAPYPFRFVTPSELRHALAGVGLVVTHMETATRTYRAGEELFEFVIAEATLA